MTPRELLEQVKVRITADPGVYDQNSFCGTQCCIAGHVDVLVNGLEVHAARNRQGVSWSEAIKEIEDAALGAMGEPEAIWLFGQPNSAQDDGDEGNPEYWPVDLSDEYETASDAIERAAVGCKAIDRYLEERGL